MTDMLYVALPQTVAEKTQLYITSLCALQFPFTGTKRPKPVPACQGPYVQSRLKEDTVCLRLEWKTWSVLYRALTDLYTFGMNWNTTCTPDLFTQPQCLTKLKPSFHFHVFCF